MAWRDLKMIWDAWISIALDHLLGVLRETARDTIRYLLILIIR